MNEFDFTSNWIGYAAVLILLLIGLSRTGHLKFLWGTGRRIDSAISHAFPSLKPFLIGSAWTLLGMISVTVIVWIVRKLRGWCKKTVFYFSGEAVRGFVAFTIDDAPGRGEPFMYEVLDLLRKNQAKCTFFIISSQVKGREEFLRRCIVEGHELANHGVDDISYHTHTAEEFRVALNHCQKKIDECYEAAECSGWNPNDAPKRIKWFRPPHGRCSAEMLRVLDQEGYSIVLCDCFGMDTVCSGDYVSKYILRNARSGSIVLMHMPEKGFREHNLGAMARVLDGFAQRGLRATSLSDMHAKARPLK